MIATINSAIAKKREEGEKGFTLIELLVVILIIGVLAAIAIPAFLNQREGSWEAQVETDLKNAALAAEQFGLENNGDFPDSTSEATVSTDGTPAGVWETSGFNGTDDVSITYSEAAGVYTLTGTHAQRGTDSWVYSSDTGKTAFTAGL